MPHYRIKEKGEFPVLVYEAPVDDKTKELRRQFDVDEETGYPRYYNWRNLAKLGPVYNPEDPFFKFGDFKKEKGYSTKLALVSFSAFIAGFGQVLGSYIYSKPLYSKPHYPIGVFCAFVYFGNMLYDKTVERASKRNMIYIDYMRKHPERFEPIHRPKLREVLLWQVPTR